MQRKVYDLSTPCLVVHKAKVKSNADKMQERADWAGVALRPHFKTSKCVEAAIIQTGGTKRCMAVSTLAEAECLQENGFEDILYAVPLSTSKIERCARLARAMNDFSVMIDSQHSLIALDSKNLGNDKQWNIFVKIDCNNGRAGILYSSDDALVLVNAIIKSNKLNFRGLYAHCGDSYHGTGLDCVHQVAKRTTLNVLELVERLKEESITCPVYGIGSTPTCSNPIPVMSKLTEWHPGNYIFYDVFQMTKGSCSQDEIACFVLTRVIGHYPQSNHMIVDCGFTALSLHGGGDCCGLTPGSGYRKIEGHPELKLAEMNQEHGLIRLVNESATLEFATYPIGTIFRIFPDHSCATAAMHRVFFIADESENIIEEWRPVSGW
ncbi:D-serine dehydratase-like [Clavelina lepadiformis]|uniref:D-serine dehydratase-like n=1 Tax=Clavelina lepadiformis TaxID=159417 RepID=UPI004041C52D